MEPKKILAEDKPPSPIFVALVSLFGYPGAGHFMVGKKRQGLIISVLFTLTTIAIIFEIAYLVPVAFSYIQGNALTISRSPNWQRMGLWVLLTAVLWVGSAVHSWSLAKRVANDTAHKS